MKQFSKAELAKNFKVFYFTFIPGKKTNLQINSFVYFG